MSECSSWCILFFFGICQYLSVVLPVIEGFRLVRSLYRMSSQTSDAGSCSSEQFWGIHGPMSYGPMVLLELRYTILPQILPEPPISNATAPNGPDLETCLSDCLLQNPGSGIGIRVQGSTLALHVFGPCGLAVIWKTWSVVVVHIWSVSES